MKKNTKLGIVGYYVVVHASPKRWNLCFVGCAMDGVPIVDSVIPCETYKSAAEAVRAAQECNNARDLY